MEKCSQPREEAVGCIFRDAIPEGMSIFGLGTLCGEGDYRLLHILNHYCPFLSTPSVRRATNEVVRGDVLIEFLSTSPARRETRRLRRGRPMVPISIHALRKEGDHLVTTRSRHRQLISIHTLCEESGQPQKWDHRERQPSSSIRRTSGR